MPGCSDSVRRRQCAATKLGRVFEEAVAHPDKSCGNYNQVSRSASQSRPALAGRPTGHRGVLHAGHLCQPGGRS